MRTTASGLNPTARSPRHYDASDARETIRAAISGISARAGQTRQRRSADQ